MSTLLQLVGACITFGLFIYFIRLGAGLSEPMQTRYFHLPLVVAGVILASIALVALIFHPALNFITQTIAVSLLGFAGGAVARAREVYEEYDPYA